jgi:hypothetical protein
MGQVNLDLLMRRRVVTRADLLMKVEAEDWHGAADACMDLREIDAQIAIIKEPLAFGLDISYPRRHSA